MNENIRRDIRYLFDCMSRSDFGHRDTLRLIFGDALTSYMRSLTHQRLTGLLKEINDLSRAGKLADILGEADAAGINPDDFRRWVARKVADLVDSRFEDNRELLNYAAAIDGRPKDSAHRETAAGFFVHDVYVLANVLAAPEELNPALKRAFEWHENVRAGAIVPKIGDEEMLHWGLPARRALYVSPTVALADHGFSNLGAHQTGDEFRPYWQAGLDLSDEGTRFREFWGVIGLNAFYGLAQMPDLTSGAAAPPLTALKEALPLIVRQMTDERNREEMLKRAIQRICAFWNIETKTITSLIEPGFYPSWCVRLNPDAREQEEVSPESATSCDPSVQLAYEQMKITCDDPELTSDEIRSKTIQALNFLFREFGEPMVRNNEIKMLVSPRYGPVSIVTFLENGDPEIKINSGFFKDERMFGRLTNHVDGIVFFLFYTFYESACWDESVPWPVGAAFATYAEYLFKHRDLRRIRDLPFGKEEIQNRLASWNDPALQPRIDRLMALRSGEFPESDIRLAHAVAARPMFGFSHAEVVDMHRKKSLPTSDLS